MSGCYDEIEKYCNADNEKIMPNNDLTRLLFGTFLRIEAGHKPSSVFDDH